MDTGSDITALTTGSLKRFRYQPRNVGPAVRKTGGIAQKAPTYKFASPVTLKALDEAGRVCTFPDFQLYAMETDEEEAVLPPHEGEEDYAGVTFRELQVNDPSLAALIWHDYTGFGVLLFGVSLLAVVLAWKGFRMGARLAWTSLLVLGLTIVAFVLVAHLPIG